jgi:hypothetical protein
MSHHPVRFGHAQQIDSRGEAVWFTAFHHGRIIACAIGVQTLTACSNDPDADPLRIFDQHRGAIERAAADLVLRNRLEPDGSVLLREADWAWLEQ